MDTGSGQKVLQKPLIIWVLILFFVIAPIFAWFLRPNPNNISVDKEYLYEVIEKYNAENPEISVPSVSIESFKVTNSMWYLLNVRSTEDNQRGKMLIADFYHDPGKMKVLSTPFTVAFERNISGIGVPYDVLEELNSEVNQGQVDDATQ